MFESAKPHIAAQLEEIRAAGTWKHERTIGSPQGATIRTNGIPVKNFCANNYLGLANHPQVVAAAKSALDDRGYGLSSVRFICGTQDRHQELEKILSNYLGTEDTILYSSCFDANAGLFETLLGPQDAVFSDALNHASIIDGIRLCKAKRFRFAHNDMQDLETKLAQATDARIRLIVSDGVFSMDGDIADIDKICDLADRYQALVVVDDSHATGFVGPTGRGTHEHHGCMGRVDVITSTLGKALGGASGGFTSGRKPIVDLLRNRSRPYLFSNTVAPAIVAGSLAALKILSESDTLRLNLAKNTTAFREGMSQHGFNIREGIHPIVPVMLGDAKLAVEFASRLLDEGIYVVGFSYPVVPEGKARIRVQLSAAHRKTDIAQAISAFTKVAMTLGVI